MALVKKTYGDVKIASIEPSANNKDWSWVCFKQEVISKYEGRNPEKSTGLGLMSILNPLENEFVGERTAYENVSNEVLKANNLNVGSIVPNVDICDYRHQTPTKDGMTLRQDGFYHTSKIVPKGTVLTVDVPLEESQREYQRWCKATGKVANSAAEDMNESALTYKVRNWLEGN